MKKFFWLIIPTLFVVMCFFSIIGTSLAVYKYDQNGGTNNIIKSGTLSAIVEGFDAKIFLNSIPDSNNSKFTETYEFTIKNTGTLPLKYRLIIEEDIEEYNKDLCTNQKNSINNIAYSIKKEDGSIITGTLSDNIIIEINHLESLKENKYMLNIWNLDNNVLGHFHGKLKLDYIIEGNNFPN